MTEYEAYALLLGKAAQARALARLTTDPITVDVLEHLARDYEAEAARVVLRPRPVQ